MRKRKKYQICVLFLEVVTLTFVLQTSLSIGFLLSPSDMCVPSFIYSYILFLRYRAKTKQVSNCCSIFRSCDLDLCPTNLNINRLPSLTIRHVCTKFHFDPTFRSYDIMRKQKKYQIFVLFLEVVTLTFDLQTSISIGFLLSPSSMCVPSFI